MDAVCPAAGRAAHGEAGAGGTMPSCFFVSDLQGREQRYLTLIGALGRETEWVKIDLAQLFLFFYVSSTFRY